MKARTLLLSSLALAVSTGIGAVHASDLAYEMTQDASIGASFGTGDLGLNDNATLLSLNYHKQFMPYQGDTPYFHGGQFGVEAQTSFTAADAETSYTTSLGGSATQEMDYFSLGLYGTHERPIGYLVDMEGINFMTKLGMAYTSRELTTTINGSTGSVDDTNFRIAYGLGLNYEINRDYKVSGEFLSNSDVDKFQVGLSYQF